jgi:hypothetical protein
VLLIRKKGSIHRSPVYWQVALKYRLHGSQTRCCRVHPSADTPRTYGELDPWQVML